MVSKVLPSLERKQTELAEFHAMLIRKDYLDQPVGCQRAQHARARRLLHQRHAQRRDGVAGAGLDRHVAQSVECVGRATYLYDTALRFCDVPFYMYRWGDRAEQASLLYLRDKWNLTIDDTFKQRLNQVGKRRRYGRKLDKILIEGMVVADRAFNRLLFMWNDRKPVPTS